VLVRSALGAQLRRRRVEQRRTLREVSGRACVSLGYLSEVERGQKEASSELLASICEALDIRLSTLLQETSEDLALAELMDAEHNNAAPLVRAFPARIEPAAIPLAPLGPVGQPTEARTGVAVDCAA
jgi:transcriptional regulator with XRE-family HTH domain